MSPKPKETLISYWPFGGGITRIQTRHPEIAKEVRRLKQTHQVGEAVVGGYLSLFGSTQPRAKLARTLKRIERRFSGAFLPRSDSRVSLASALKRSDGISDIGSRPDFARPDKVQSRNCGSVYVR